MDNHVVLNIQATVSDSPSKRRAMQYNKRATFNIQTHDLLLFCITFLDYRLYNLLLGLARGLFAVGVV
jgi:hypothetical protein